MAVNQAPISRITAPATAKVGESVVFDPTASTDVESGKNLKVSYTFGDEVVKQPLVPVRHVFATAGTYVVEQTVYDRAGKSGKALHTIVVTDEVIDPPPPVVVTIEPAELPAMTEGVPVSAQLIASGGAAPYTFGLSTGLPPGVTITMDGQLIGTPTAAGPYSVVVSAMDAKGVIGTRTYSGIVEAKVIDPPPPDPVPPTITEHPKSTSVISGQSVTLTVVASGDAPLTYQWRRNGQPIPGATASSYLTGPMTTASGFDVIVTNPVGSVTSEVAQIAVTVPDTPPGLITPEWFTYRGCFKSPYYTPYSYGTLTGYRVHGEHRLLIMGNEAQDRSPLLEMADPGSYNPNHLAAPMASARRLWPFTAYQGRRGRFEPDGSIYEFPMNLAVNSSVVRIPLADRLRVAVSFDEIYNTAGIPNQNVLVMDLFDNGESAVAGPFRLAAHDKSGQLLVGSRAVQILALDPNTGGLIGASGWSSGNAAFSWGPSLHRGAAWPDFATPAGYDLNYLVPERLLRHYCMLGLIDRETGIVAGNGPCLSFRRKFKPHDFERFDGVPPNDPRYPEFPEGTPPDPALWINKAHYGYASWAETDSTQGILHLKTQGGEGILFGGSLNPDTTFYMNVFKQTCPSHGKAMPLNEHGQPFSVTGPCSTKLFPYLMCYDPADLEKVRTGQLQDWQPEPVWTIDCEERFGVYIRPSNFYGGGGFSGLYFDEETTQLYVQSRGTDFHSLIHVFKVQPPA